MSDLVFIHHPTIADPLGRMTANGRVIGETIGVKLTVGGAMVGAYVEIGEGCGAADNTLVEAIQDALLRYIERRAPGQA